MRKVPDYTKISDSIKSAVQGGILEPYSDITHGLAILLHFKELSGALFFLNSIVPAISTANSPHLADEDTIFHNLAFTLEGLRACALTEDMLDQFPEDFRQGMAQRCGVLGDVRNNHPRRWRLPDAFAAANQKPQANLQIELGNVHAVLHLRTKATKEPASKADYHWHDGHPLQRRLTEIADMSERGVKVLAVQSMRRRYRTINGSPVIVEPFGYADGNGQPDLKKGTNSQPQSHLGEIVCGYNNLADSVSTSPSHPSIDFLTNGSFLVMRKYGQNVMRFNDAVNNAALALVDVPLGGEGDADAKAKQAAALKTATVVVQSKLMGRTQNGEPLVAFDPTNRNDFNFKDDPVGKQCPLHAHIRLANPRSPKPTAGDDVDLTGDGTARPPVIMRRSMSYGPVSAQDDEARGLMFMAYNANISEQFEVIQRWLTQGNSTGSSSLQSCPIVGVPENHYPRQFRFEYELDGKKERVTHMGLELPTPMFTEPAAYTWLEWGLYLFTPSIAVLSRLHSLALAKLVKTEAAGPLRCPIAPAWKAQEGRAKLKQLQDIQMAQGDAAALLAWKAAVEDPQAIQRLESAALWAAIREDHGGLLRTPYGVIVANRSLIQQVFKDNENFSVCGHRERMKLSFGDIFIGKDAGSQDGDIYADEAGSIPSALSQLPLHGVAEGVFEISRDAAMKKLDQIVQVSKDIARNDDALHYETGFDSRELLDEVLAELTENWFGIQGSPFFKRSGSDSNWQEGNAPHFILPLYPGHFAAPSRYMFQPNPGSTPTALGQVHGRALKRAMLSFAAPYYYSGSFPKNGNGNPAPVAKAVLDDAAQTGKTLEFVASTMVGIIMGYTPTINGAVLNVLTEWAKNDTLFEKRAMVDALGDLSYQQAYDLMYTALSNATKMQPMPQITWRTARTAMRLGEPGPHAIDIHPNDKIVLALVSGTQESLVDGVDDGRIMFGGVREEDPHPTHACPGYHQGIAAALGCLAAIVGLIETLRPGRTPHNFEIRGKLKNQQSPSPTFQLHREKVAKEWKSTLEWSAKKPVAGSRGKVICWGDSWVAYLGEDIQSKLQDLGYETPEDYCSYGDYFLLDTMAESGEIKKFTKYLKELGTGATAAPKAIFLSGGGNDSVGEKLYAKLPQPGTDYLLNPKSGSPPVINPENLAVHLAALLAAYRRIIQAIIDTLDDQKWKTPIVVHGYAYPQPAVRPLTFGSPKWIKDPFAHAGYKASGIHAHPFDKAVATEQMHNLIEALNKDVFVVLEKEFSKRVLYVDLRKIAPLEDDWENDMHLNPDKFEEAASLIDVEITEFWGKLPP